MSERGQLMKKKQEQAGADLCQAQFKLGLAKPVVVGMHIFDWLNCQA